MSCAAGGCWQCVCTQRTDLPLTAFYVHSIYNSADPTQRKLMADLPTALHPVVSVAVLAFFAFLPLHMTHIATLHRSPISPT